ncbi:hypothetical protein [Aeromonas hydrophila]|uniref:hypothetical protein n=1 Tax=Aeromonas hydrophila TaxID=644 RepID=UPI001F1DEB41|nr:hypothetical protein [Aeromonas hydrophila]
MLLVIMSSSTFYVLMVHCPLVSSCLNSSNKNPDLVRRHTVYQPDKTQILSRFQQTCTAKSAFHDGFESRFDGELKLLDELIKATFKIEQITVKLPFFGQKNGATTHVAPFHSQT